MIKSVVVLISGSGSNLQAIIDAASRSTHFKVRGVLSNKADAFGLVRAKDAAIETAWIDHKAFDSRESFDSAMMQQIDAWGADLIVLAGFMRILSSDFVRHYAGRLINIHPSLLPKYKGLNTHQRALDEGEFEHGCTVHFVNEELDGGAPIIHAATPILPNDTVHSLQQRVHTLEHQIYPIAVDWFTADRLTASGASAELDSKPLGPSGIRFNSL